LLGGGDKNPPPAVLWAERGIEKGEIVTHSTSNMNYFGEWVELQLFAVS
jgi:hypothetical protein